MKNLTINAQGQQDAALQQGETTSKTNAEKNKAIEFAVLNDLGKKFNIDGFTHTKFKKVDRKEISILQIAEENGCSFCKGGFKWREDFGYIAYTDKKSIPNSTKMVVFLLEDISDFSNVEIATITLCYKKQRCPLCGKMYGGYGHNAAPLSEERCCTHCNNTKVIPARIKKFVEQKKQEESVRA